MEHRTVSIVIGASIGGFVGWIVGDLVASHYAPEYEDIPATKADKNEYYKKEYEKKVRRYSGEDQPLDEEKVRINYAAFHKVPLETLFEEESDFDMTDDEEDYEVEEGSEEDEEDYEVEEGSEEDELDYDQYLAMFGENQIRLMSEEEFYADKTYKETILLYYGEDDVLCNDTNQPLEAAVEKVVGEDALVSFGIFSGDPDSVYVLNKKLKAKYKIAWLHESYEQKFLSGNLKEKPKKVVKNVFDDTMDPEASDEEDA